MKEELPTNGDLLDQIPETAPEVAAHNQGDATAELRNLALVDRSSEGLSDTSMAGSLQGLIDLDPKRFNIGVALSIYASWATEENRRFNLQRKQMLDAQSNAAEVSRQLTNAQVENAGLKAGINERRKIRPLVNFTFLCGPILIGIGLDQLRSLESSGTGFSLIIIGIVFIVVAFFISTTGGEA